MQITVNLTDPRANSIALDEVIFSQAETTLTFNVSPSTESLADGLSVALLTPQGETLAHALVSASAAVLSTSTVECYEFVKNLPIEAARGAYLVIGESTSPKAIIPVQVARNPIAEIAPPTETAPVYPTSQELQETLARIEAALTKIEEVEDIVEGFDETVQQGIAELNATKESAIGEVAATKTSALAEVNTAKANALAAIDTAEASAVAFVGAKAQEGGADIIHAAETGVALVNQATGNAVDEIGAVKTQAEGELTALVGQAQTAKGEAETARDEALVARTGAEAARTGAENAQHGAEAAQQAAETALNNGCVYKVVDLGNSSIIDLRRETTIYKITPLSAFSIAFSPPTLNADEVIVFWLWIVMGATAYELTLPATFIGSEPSLAANTETLLAFMSTDGGATWQANVQWEKAVTA